MSIKVNNSFFEKGNENTEKNILRYIKNEFKSEDAADFFELESSEDSIEKFVTILNDNDVYDQDLIKKLLDRIIRNELHPLQCIRISRLLFDPDEDVDGEDKELLINHALDLEWAKEFRSKN